MVSIGLLLLVVVVVVVIIDLLLVLMMTVARQMREMGGDFVLNPLLDVVSVNVKMLVIFLDVDNLNRRRRVAQVRPRVCRIQVRPRVCRICN